MPYAALLHSHVSAWAIGLVLFIIALILANREMKKGFKVVQMILRLFYILIIATGISLLITLQFPLSYIIKGILAIWLFYVMETVLVKGSKGELEPARKRLYYTQLVASLLFIFLIGYKVI